jgi:tetraacyldisaccharide 4'-kinase
MPSSFRPDLWLQERWYGRREPELMLKGLEAAFRGAVALRRLAYRRGWQRAERLPVPVIVVGNLSVGGTGKTPLTIWLAEFLKAQGYRPGIVSRGYGSTAGRTPLRVTPDTDPALAGDEPVLIARRTGCPVFVGKRRAEAGRALLAQTGCNLVIADDGLQHYALARDLEIAVVDGARGFGNGRCLPAGPLREPPERLSTVDLAVYSGPAPAAGGYPMRLEGFEAVNLHDETRRRPLREFTDTTPLFALAGIGHPERFFEHLRNHGLAFEARAFPDHHRYRPEDLAFAAAGTLLMTEKDAVKCRGLAGPGVWSVPVTARLPGEFGGAVLERLRHGGT